MPERNSTGRARVRELCGQVVGAQTSDAEGEAIQLLRRELVRPPVTMAMADELEAGGFYDTADIARLYAIDRPRWWHRFRRAR